MTTFQVGEKIRVRSSGVKKYSDLHKDPVLRRGEALIVETVREDGSYVCSRPFYKPAPGLCATTARVYFDLVEDDVEDYFPQLDV